jgi:exonuclease SbcC
MRYGETENTLVFDISDEDKEKMNKGELLFDDIYDKVMEDPVAHINKIKSGEIPFLDMVSIAGIIGGDANQSNGAGKSTVFEGMCYVVYDKIVRKNVNTDKTGAAGKSTALKLNGEHPVGMKESYVEMLFEVDGKIYVAKRGREFSLNRKTKRPSSSDPFFTLDWVNAPTEDDQSGSGHRKSSTNESILNAVGMDYDVFVNSVMFAQSDAGKFLTGSDKTRKEMFVSLLMLEEIINSCLKEIRDDKNAQEKVVSDLKFELNIGEQHLTKYAEDYNDAIKKCEELIKSNEELIKKIDEKIIELSQSDEMKLIDSIKAEGKSVKESLLKVRSDKEEQIKVWQNHIDDTNKSAETKTNELKELMKKIPEARSAIEAKKKSIEEFDLEGQEKELALSKKAGDFIEKYLKEEKALKEESDEWLVKLTTERAKRDSLQKEIDFRKKQIEEAGDSSEFFCDKCKNKVSKEHLQSEIKENELEKESAEKAIKGLEGENDRVKKALEDASQKTAKLKERINNQPLIEKSIKNYEEDKGRISEMEEDLKAKDRAKETLERGLKFLREKNVDYKNKLEEVSKEFDENIENLEKDIKNLGEKLISAQKGSEEIQSKIEKLKSGKEEKSKESSQAERDIGEYKRFNQEIKEVKENIAKIKKDIQIEDEKYHRLLILEEICGLEGVQARFTEKYLPLFNDHVKEILDILTDGKIGMELSLNSKAKIDMALTGGMGETFDLISGGERMLIRLGTDIAMGLLKFSRSTTKAEMIALDEIFGPLDNSHSEAVFKLLEVLRGKFKRVIVISHKDDISKKIPHKIIVEKDVGEYGLSKIKSIV